MLRIVQLLLLVFGLAAFLWLIAATGLDTLWEQSQRLGLLGTLAIVGLGGIELLLHAVAWRRCFPRDTQPTLPGLLLAHFAGNAVSLVTPTATAGGELVRVTLLPDGPSAEAGSGNPVAVPSKVDAAASIAVDRLTYAISDALLGLMGVAVLLGASELAPALRYGLAAGTGLVVVGIAIFAMLQRSGRLVGLVTGQPLLARLLGPALAEELHSSGRAVDRRIEEHHGDSGNALLASTALHLLANAMGLAQLACLVGFSGIDASGADLFRVFVVVTAIDLAAFFVPGRLGAQEGARMVAVTLAGLPIELGLLFSLAQRLEQIVWIAIGLGGYAVLLARRPGGAAGGVT